MDSSEFFGGPAPAPSLEDDKDGYGRYLLDATGTGKTPFTRATTLAKMLDNPGGLEIWKQRKAAKGVASSPALTARAAVTPLDDKRAWREILDQAGVHSGGDEKRELGSAFHAFHEHVGSMTDEEYAAVPHELRVTYERYRAELDRLGITEVMTEVTVANTEIGVAGKLDAIFRLADGRLVIGDRKSGRITEYPHAACVQLATYANANVMITYDENGAVQRHPMPDLDKTTALVVDITIGGENTAAVHVYELDIWSGWAAALLSTKIRAWRNRRDLVTPYHPSELPVIRQDYRGGPIETQPATAPGSVYTDGTTGGYHSADEVPPATPEQRAEFAAELPPSQVGFPVAPATHPAANANSSTLSPTAAAVLGTGPAIGTGNAVQPPHAGTHPAWSSKDQKVIQLDSKGERVPDAPTLADAAGAQADSGADDVAALLATFKTKAQLQGVLSSVAGPGANLARQRKNLALDIVSHPTWPQRRAEFLPPEDPAGVDYAAVQEAAAAEVFSPVVSNAPGPVPPDPEPGFPTRTGVTGDEMDTSTSSANPFTPPPAPEPVEEPLEDQLLVRLGSAATQQDIAAIWEEARDGGIGWPARLDQAAKLRMTQLTAPAAN